jgi:uncharacterized membrane protein
MCVLLIPLLTGAIFVIAALVQLKFPPKKINWSYGYRTRRSTQSEAAWVFAQRYGSIELLKLGAALMAMSPLGCILPFGELQAFAFGLIPLIGGVVLMIIRVERALKRRFEQGEEKKAP